MKTVETKFEVVRLFFTEAEIAQYLGKSRRYVTRMSVFSQSHRSQARKATQLLTQNPSTPPEIIALMKRLPTL